MTTAHRVIIVLYCVLIAYCLLWVPWHRHISASADAYLRLGYGWLWAGPGGEQGRFGTPDITPICLRLIASTAVAAAAFVLSDIRRRKTPL